MALYVTIKCDGMMPPRSKERCRAGFSVQADTYLGENGDVIVVDDVIEQAERHGWTEGDRDTPTGKAFAQFCPSCTRHRAEGAA